VAKKNVTMPRAHYNAVRRVLRLLDGYLRSMPDALHGFDGGVMTTTELWTHAQAAIELMPAKRAKRKVRR
jgi:hypothetical protein